MTSRLFLSFMLLALAFPVAAETSDKFPAAPEQKAADGAGQPAQGPDEHQKAMYERRRAELEGKLKVEQVLLKGVGSKGVEIEISYRIVDVDAYAAHPKTTFIADETSNKLVPLTILAKLFDPLPAEEAEKVPPAKLTIWDKKGVIRPGQPVTVVVAGYGQRHLIPVAAPGYDPDAVVNASTPKRNPDLVAADAELTVHKVNVIADGHMLRVDYSSKGIKELDADPDQTFIEDPETGNRYPIVKVPRLGALAPEHIDGLAGSYMVIDNAGRRIKAGQKVNVYVTGVRAENIPVVEE